MPPEVQSPDHSWVDGYDQLIASFVASVLDGGQLLGTPEDGRENVRVVLAAYKAAESGREVAIGTHSAEGVLEHPIEARNVQE